MNNKQNFLTKLQESVDKDIETIVESQDYAFHETTLKKSQALKQEFKTNLEKLFDLQSLFNKGLATVTLILENIHLACSSEDAEKIKKELKESDQHFINYLNQMNENKEVSGQEDFQHIYHLSNETLFSIYLLAQHFYNYGEIEKAKDILSILTFLSPRIPSFWIGLGVCYQHDKYFEEALISYEIAELLNSANPEAIVRKIECLLDKKEKKEAEEEFKKLNKVLKAHKELQSVWKPSVEALGQKLGRPLP